MWICNQYFNLEIINRIQLTVDNEPSISRREISRRICEWLGWRGINGKLKDMSCRKALLELNRRGLINLPKCKRRYFFQSTNPLEEFPEILEVKCSLAELGDIEILPVKSRYSKASRIWKALLTKFQRMNKHPCKW